MVEPDKIMKIGRRSTLLKALILLALAGISISLVEISPIKAHLGPDQFQRIIGEAGLMGPALLVIFCAVGTCLFVPVNHLALRLVIQWIYLSLSPVCPSNLSDSTGLSAHS